VVIEVNSNVPAVLVNGFRIETAPPVGELLSAIGSPTRVYAGPTPAPTGFRNNQQHVFDALGVHVNEHHHTRRAREIGVTLSVEERKYGFTPTSAFNGALLFDGVRMPLQATEAEFVKTAPWAFEESIAGLWRYQFGGFSVGFDAIGPKLPTRRRSEQRVVVEVCISWPHDPHGQPAGGR
jgi:hypothetical protein